MTIVRNKLAAVVLPLILAAGLTACQKQESASGQGPAEQAGKVIDSAASKAGTELSKAGEVIGQTMEKAAEKGGQAMEKAGEKMQSTAQESKSEVEQKKE
jgi:hypothetical protein